MNSVRSYGSPAFAWRSRTEALSPSSEDTMMLVFRAKNESVYLPFIKSLMKSHILNQNHFKCCTCNESVPPGDKNGHVSLTKRFPR